MLADSRFELPPDWRAATFPSTNGFGSALSRPHPRETVVLRWMQEGRNGAFGIWDATSGKFVRVLPHAADARWMPDGKCLITVDASLTLAVLDWPDLSIRRQTRAAFDPRAGVGGVDVAISASGRLGSLSIFSGQSEEGYVLFSLPELATLATLPYVSGESAAPCLFSPDDRYLTLVVERAGQWWSPDEGQADSVTPAEGALARWATIHIQETRKGGLRAEQPILVDLPRGWTPGDALAGATWPSNVRFTNAAQLTFDLPWGGTYTMEFPPTEPCLVPPPPFET